MKFLIITFVVLFSLNANDFKAKFNAEIKDNNLFCPKCGTQVIQDNEMFDASKMCKHVMFVAHDEGFEFSKNEEIVSNFEEDEESDDSLDEYLSKLDVQNGLLFTKYASAPYFSGSYVGFDFREN